MSKKGENKINRKQSIIEKTAAGSDISPEQLKKINNLTRRKLNADDVFAFSIILCDNEVDRDGERFPRKSLETLAELYIGKTGVFDHSAQAKHQSARIFDTEIVASNHRTAPGGETYTCLKAWAYMVRCDKNNDLILEIDAGIKKEVSVGCAVRQTLCSVCSADQKQGSCGHEKGESYGGVTCHHMLCDPTDAYEWSFVAVPSQRNAGVTKEFAPFDKDVLERIYKSANGITLTGAEAQSLKARLVQLDGLCKSGEEYLSSLKRDLIRKAGLAQPSLDSQALEEVASTMTVTQLKAFCKGFDSSAAAALPSPQLAPQTDNACSPDHQFLI